MGTGQVEIGAPVVEGFLIHEHDIGGASLVVGMAACAIGAGYISYAAVETLCRVDIARNFLVTGGTELCLPGLLERFMTFAAGIFELGVTLDKQTGHDQPFQILRTCRICRKHQHDHGNEPRNGPDLYRNGSAKTSKLSDFMHNWAPSFPRPQYM